MWQDLNGGHVADVLGDEGVQELARAIAAAVERALEDREKKQREIERESEDLR